MNFGAVFGSSVLIFFFICLGIFMHSQMTATQKMVVLYLSCYVAGYIGVFRKIYDVLIVILIQFIYTEYISDDMKKMEVIRKFRFKLLDYIYKFCFIYKTWLYILAEVLISYRFKLIIGEEYSGIATVISFGIVCLLIQKMCAPKFQTNNISQIMDTFMRFPPYQFPTDVEKEKFYILSDIEDKSYFARENTYNVISFEFIKYKIGRVRDWNLKSPRSIKKLIKKAGVFIQRSKNIRGYSTIEMQLLRIIAVSGGYTRTFNRKIYEFFYTKIFITSLREYYRYHVSGRDSNFKSYLIWVYYNVVPVTLWRHRYSSIRDVFNCSVDKWTMEQLFVVILALSGRSVYGNTMENYRWVIDKYQMSIQDIYEYADRGLSEMRNEVEFSFTRWDGHMMDYYETNKLHRLLDENKEDGWNIKTDYNNNEYLITLTMKEPVHLINIEEYIKKVEWNTEGEYTHSFG